MNVQRARLGDKECGFYCVLQHLCAPQGLPISSVQAYSLGDNISTCASHSIRTE